MTTAEHPAAAPARLRDPDSSARRVPVAASAHATMRSAARRAGSRWLARSLGSLRRQRPALLLPLLLVGCASALPPVAVRPTPLPEDLAARKLALGQIGRQLYVALAEGQPERLLIDELELRSVLEAEAATRVAALRARGSAPGLAAAELRAAFSGTTYHGICFDRARTELAGSRLGLVTEGFVFDRALVVGVQPGGGRVAAWIEGTFVGTGDLVYALILSRVEAPRREHADLELMQCDLADGLQPPRPVVVEPAAPY